MKYWATRSPRTIKQVLSMKAWVTDSTIEMKISFQDTIMQIRRNSMYLQNKLNSCMTILSVTKNEFHTVKCFICNYDGHVAKYCHIIICDSTIYLYIRIKIVQRKPRNEEKMFHVTFTRKYGQKMKGVMYNVKGNFRTSRNESRKHHKRVLFK